MSRTGKRCSIFIPIKCQSWNLRRKNNKYIENLRVFLQELIQGRFLKSKFNNLSLNITFFFKGKYSGDIDNLLKTLFDLLQRADVIKNDNQIKKLEAEILEEQLMEGVSIDFYRYK